MKAPEINIKFIEAAVSIQSRVDKGVVLLIINEILQSDVSNPVNVIDENDIPTTFSDTSKEYIKLALKGYNGEAPKKITVYCTGVAEAKEATALPDETFNKIFKAIAKLKFAYMAMPNAVEADYKKVKNWIIEQREAGNKVKAVLPNTEGDNEGIINYINNKNVVSEEVKAEGETTTVQTEYTAAQFTSRIAGLLAAIPSSYSATYVELDEVIECDEVEDRDDAVNKGKFFIYNDGEKIKTCRAVNSLQTIPEGKSEDFKKIRVVHIMDTINSDVSTLIEDNYIGKYPNTYDNKCVLITAIDEYLTTIEGRGMLNSHSVDIDTAAQKEYLKEHGYDVAEMTNDEIKQALTGTHVYISGTAAILDAIEDIDWNINI